MSRRLPAALSRRAFVGGSLAFATLGAAPLPNRAAALVAAARAQIGVTLAYDPAYTRLAFPGGDVPRARGVCTDVVVRAYRDALGLDLQALVAADMRAAWSAYPRTWGLARPDTNIDHRRVSNLRAFLRRQGAALPLPVTPDGWRPGDLFTALIGARLPHIGMVSAPGRMIHNIGAGTREEPMLTGHPLTGRYRWALD